MGTRAVQIWDADTQKGEGTGDSPCRLRPLPGHGGGCEWGLWLPGDLNSEKIISLSLGSRVLRGVPAGAGGHPSRGARCLSPPGDVRRGGPARRQCQREEAEHELPAIFGCL